MCTIVTLPDGTEIQSVAALRARWTIAPDDLDFAVGENECLCNVDVEAVLRRAGVTYEPDPWGFAVTIEVEEGQ